ncbi:hypothetical protein Gpo141_00005402 [Globisporangium polare]
MPESRFPLAKDKLPTLHVDAQTVAQWQRTARDEILALLGDRKSWYYKGPRGAKKSVFDKKGVQGFSLSDESSRKKEFFGQGLLRLSLEDTAYALYCEQTHQQRLVSAYLDEEYFLDAAVLDVYAQRSVEDPFHFAGVKWAAYNSPQGLVTQYSDPNATTKSDFVYFEYSCKTRDVDGKIVLVQYISSPQLSSEELKEHHVGLARGKHSQISTFSFMEEGTQFKTMGAFEAGSQVPAWVSMKCVRNAFSNPLSLVGLADARAISGLGSTTPASTTKTCYLCKKKFGLMRARLNCHSCGQCICKQCTLKVKFIDENGLFSSSTPLLAEDKFCLQCVSQSREQRPECGSFCEPVGDSISSEESSTTLRTSLDEQLQQNQQESFFDTDFSDLHDDIEDDIVIAAPSSRSLFDHNGARHKPKAQYATHEPVYTDKVISIKGSSRPLTRLSPQHKQQQHEKSQPQSKQQPKISPVEAFLAKAKAEQQRAAAASKMKQQKTEDPAYAIPVAGPGSEVFSKLTQSIAAQEKLLASIQQEARNIRARTASQEHQFSPSSSSSSLSQQQQRRRHVDIPENDRFEVVA